MDEQLIKIQKLLDAAEGNLASARNMLRVVVGNTGKTSSVGAASNESIAETTVEESVIEGTFNGEEMIAKDGKNYPVPANYASKSKLVEGDGLKLTIAEDGSFIFKQIAPVERKSLVGNLNLDGSNYTVLADGKSYKVLTASITFYKAEPGDQVTIIVPKEGEALWGALENVVSKETKATEPEIIPASKEESSAIEPTTEEKPVEPVPTTDETTVDLNIDKVLQPSADLPPIELPNNETAADKSPIDISKSVEESTKNTTPVEEIAKTTGTDAAGPKIEFPGESGNENLSDDQLLENLKNNLKNMSAPDFVSPVTVTETKSTVSPTISQQGASSQKPAADEPISELEI